MPPADVAPTTNARCPCRMDFSRAENGGAPPQLENPPPPTAYSPWGSFLAVSRLFAVCHPGPLFCHIWTPLACKGQRVLGGWGIDTVAVIYAACKVRALEGPAAMKGIRALSA